MDDKYKKKAAANYRRLHNDIIDHMHRGHAHVYTPIIVEDIVNLVEEMNENGWIAEYNIYINVDGREEVSVYWRKES